MLFYKFDSMRMPCPNAAISLQSGITLWYPR